MYKGSQSEKTAWSEKQKVTACVKRNMKGDDFVKENEWRERETKQNDENLKALQARENEEKLNNEVIELKLQNKIKPIKVNRKIFYWSINILIYLFLLTPGVYFV